MKKPDLTQLSGIDLKEVFKEMLGELNEPLIVQSSAELQAVRILDPNTEPLIVLNRAMYVSLIGDLLNVGERMGWLTAEVTVDGQNVKCVPPV